MVAGNGSEVAHFILKARLSTLAIQGLTPEEAESVNNAAGTAAAGTGGTGGTGGGKP
jgi:hypothetical protein